MKVSELLTNARAIIATPDKWHKGSYACNSDGEARLSSEDDAVRFCVLGAMDKAAGIDDNEDSMPRSKAVNLLIDYIGDNHVASFNDSPSTTHADVMAMFDNAIARARKMEEMA